MGDIKIEKFSLVPDPATATIPDKLEAFNEYMDGWRPAYEKDPDALPDIYWNLDTALVIEVYNDSDGVFKQLIEDLNGINKNN